MSRIYIVRHGQSAANVSGGFCGFLDVALSELGEKQAAMTAAYLKDFRIDKIISSPLIRAYSTALPIAAYHRLKVETHEGLKEMNFGEWEGMRGYAVAEKYGEAFTRWKNEPWKVECPNGESFVNFYDRATSTLLELANANADKDICITTHGAWTKSILCYVKGIGIENFQNIEYPANASVTTLEYDGSGFTLIEEGHWEHLGDDVTRVNENINKYGNNQ